MLSDLTLARAAFSQSRTSVDAQLRVATLRLQARAIQTRAELQAGPDASVEVVADEAADHSPPADRSRDRVDKTA